MTIFWILPDYFDSRQDKSSWLEMARELQLLGWKVRILAVRSSAAAANYDDLVHYHKVPRIPFLFRWLALACSCLHIIRHRDSDSVVILNQDALWFLPVMRLAGLRRVHLDIRTLPVRMRGFKSWLDEVLFWKLPMRLLARRADTFSFITEPLRKAVQTQFGVNFLPYCIWQSGVNTTLFHGSGYRRSPDGTFRLFYHGQLISTRGLGEVLEGLASAQFPREVHFDIVGDGADRQALEQRSQALGLSNSVHFHGYFPYEQVVERIANADCCICPLPDLPEWRVSSPLKVLEYLACEKPVILTPMLAHTEVATDLPSVFWTRGYAPADFSRAIVEVIETLARGDVDCRSGRQRIVDNFRWTSHAQRLSKLLLETTKQGGAGAADTGNDTRRRDGEIRQD
ncbi:MAG: glycosyltransferase [Pseudomonadales bacterium]|nr:glycosyltransferase [Pseudomonadales bacterium]MCP5185874.1 glycosyltransferase [Pseudomonadales bacterium]